MTVRLLRVLVLFVAAVCAGGCVASISRAVVVAEPLFSFVVLADPHIDGSPGPTGRLQACARWINEHREAERIEIVVVAGDLGGRIERARDLLDDLDVSWVPVIGDNNVQAGRGPEFERLLAAHFENLAARLEGWRKAPTPVKDPGTGEQRHLVNFSFDLKGVHFVGLDWCERRKGKLRGEQADLQAIPGGTLAFLKNDLASCPKPREENIVLFSHHPMHALFFGVASFSPSEFSRICAVTRAHRDHVYGAFAGHYHINLHERENRCGYEVFVTDATHEDDNTIRLVCVYDDGTRISYEHRLVEVP